MFKAAELAQAAGVQFLHVPYQSGGQAMNAPIAGQVNVAVQSAVREAVEHPVFRQAMASMDSPVEYLDAPEFQRFMDRDGARLTEAVHRMGKIE